jgi:xanthine dehydrogenase accessory factor
VAEGRAGALLTRLDPPDIGAKLLVLDDGRQVGSLGDAALDQLAVGAARDGFATGASRTLTLGGVRVFAEIHMPSPTLLVVGAGHVAMPLVTLAKVLGFRTVVVDGRPRLATRERFPEADELVVGIPSEIARRVPALPTTAVVLVAHDYKYDLPVLRQVLASPVGYVGLLGSRRRGDAIVKLLREEGIAEEQLVRIRVPIGLDLGARSAAEIALAVVAEIVAARYGGSGRPLSHRGGAPTHPPGGYPPPWTPPHLGATSRP